MAFQAVLDNLAREQLLDAPWTPPDWFPSGLLAIKYPALGQEAKLGNQITGVDAKEEPEVYFKPQELGALYTLVMLDPDAPSREAPTAGLLNHWLIPNLRHSPSGTGATPLDKPDEAWVPHAGPSLKREGHRLVFLLYRQGRRLKGREEQKLVKEVREVEDRFHFDLEGFVAENQLELVGVNFFISKLHQA